MANSSFFKNTGTSSQLQGSASASAAAALASEQAALVSENAAATSETNAAASAAAALVSKNAAANSAASTLADSISTAADVITAAGHAATTTADATQTNLDKVATNADVVLTNADVVSTNADVVLTNADVIAAAASAAAAANSYDQFDDRYLGSLTGYTTAQTGPSLDNDGNTLVSGSLFFSADANEMRVYDGAGWIAASSAGSSSLINYHYTATAAQTTFSGADDNSNTLSYTVDNLIVTKNGIVLEVGTDYTATNGTSIVLAVAAAAGDEINVVAFKSFTTADMVSATNGGTFQGNVDFAAGADVTGNITVTGTVDGRDVATDGAKLDGIESLADVTDATNVLAAGAAMLTGATFTGAVTATSFTGDGANLTNLPVSTPTLSSLGIANHDDITVDGSGNVGLGTASPSTALDVTGTVTADGLTVDGTAFMVDTNEVQFYSSDYGIRASSGLEIKTGDFIRFLKGATEHLRITSTGKLETSNRDFGFINHGTSVSLADDAFITINAGTAGGGLLAIYETASGGNALFRVGYLSCAALSGAGSVSFASADTDGAVCVYSYGHNIYIKNRLGASKSFFINMFMAGNNFA